MPSLGEIMFIVCGSMLLVGKEELPGLARVLGRGLGGVVGFMQGARTQFSRLGKVNASMETLREEIRNNMADLRQIQSEIQSAGMMRGGGEVSAALPGSLHPGSQVRRSQRKTGDTGAAVAAAGGGSSISSFSPPSGRHPLPSMPAMELDGCQEDHLARLAMAEVQLEEIDKEDGGLSTRHCRGPVAPAGQELGSHILSQVLCDQLVLRALNNHLQDENLLHNDNSKDL